MKRRDFIKASTVKTISALAGASLFLKACHTEEDMIGEPNWIVEGDFTAPLQIPSVVTSNVQLQAGANSVSILKGKHTYAFSYGDGILGPTIKANTGGTVNVHLQNNLSDMTNIHWHGLILPENMDGHPRDVAEAGSSLQYSLPIIQRAGTYWYHPHPHGDTARQVFMGLAGMFIVNDQEEASLNLPSGDFEIPLIIQDKRFSGDALDYSPTEDEMMTGYLAENITVNGIHSPVREVASTWYRMRVLNGATARVFNLGFSNGMKFHIIGADGGLLQNPEEVAGILLGPGERLDILVDFSTVPPGKEIFLVSNKFSKFNAQGRQSFNILKFRIAESSNLTFTLPGILSNISRMNAIDAIQTRRFDIAVLMKGEGMGPMGKHSINGKTFHMDRVDETVSAGTTEIWEFDNGTGDEIHPMHVHGVQFQVLERKGGRNQLIASEKGWKDTVLLMPGEKVKVIMKFPDYKGVFVFHCHNLEHEDDGMMLNYEIV